MANAKGASAGAQSEALGRRGKHTYTALKGLQSAFPTVWLPGVKLDFTGQQGCSNDFFKASPHVEGKGPVLWNYLPIQQAGC